MAAGDTFALSDATLPGGGSLGPGGDSLGPGGDSLGPGGGSLGPYRLIRRLGAGGMGQVFAAERIAQSQQSTEAALAGVVALKQIAVHDPTLLVRFKQEFRSLADLRHPNLVRLGELVVLPTGLAFYTMELVDGVSLVRWVRRQTPAGTAPSIPRLCHALRQLAAGVAHLHRSGRVHRDIKPSNVLVSDEGRVVILDFGLVLELGVAHARITGTGQLIGTPAYMAPEQGARDSAGPAVDLYALGVTLFECLTGCMPFVGSPVRVLLDKQHSRAPDPRELAEAIPDWLAQLCRALLDVQPQQRPSAEAIIAALDEQIGASVPAVALDDEFCPRLVGRDDELALLERVHAQVEREGKTSAVLLSGPPGRGKSALLDEFLARPRSPASIVLRGRCHPRESMPYKGVDSLIDALTMHLRALPREQAAALRPRHVRELCELFPVLAGIWSESARRVLERDPVSRKRFGIAALRELLARLGDDATLVLAIDDFQWADLDGFNLLTEVLQPPEPPVLLLVLLFDRSTPSPVLDRLLEPNSLRPAARSEFELAPLNPGDAEALALALLDPRLVADPHALAQQLAHASGGEPLALVRDATARGPADVSQVADDDLRERIAALSATAKQLLTVAYVAGDRVSNALAQRVLGCSDAAFEAAVHELVDAGMSSGRALEPDGVLEFARARIPALMHVDTGAPERARIHVRLAEILAERGEDHELIAAHFEAGGALAQAREHVTRAASWAAETLAFVRAEQLYRRALDLLAREGDASEPAQRESCDLRLALAEQLQHLARSPEAAALFAEVAEIVQPRQPELAAQLRLRAAEQYAISGWSQLALPLLRELMRAAGEWLPSNTIGALLIFALNRLRLLWQRGEFRALPPEQRDAQALARFDLVYAACMALSRGRLGASLALWPRAMLLGLRAGDPARMVPLLVSNATLQTTFGRFTRAWTTLGEAQRVAGPEPGPLLQAYLHLGFHFYHVRRLQLELAESHFDQAQRNFEQLAGHTWIQAPACHLHAILLRQCGAYRRLRRQLPAWHSRLHDFGHHQHDSLVLGEEALALAQAGELADARRSLALARARWQVEFYTFNDYLLGIAEVWVLLGEGRASEAEALARKTTDDMRRNGHAWFKLPRARMHETRIWAQLLHAIAQRDATLAPSERELARLRRVGMPQLAAAAEVATAGLASLRGDRARTIQLWRAALHACELSDMHGYAAALCWRLAASGVDDAPALGERARAYFEAQDIADVGRFVRLLAPGREQVAALPATTP